MKISIVSFAFYESTLPLAKYLSIESDIQVYALFSEKFLSPPNFDISDLVLNINTILNFEKEEHYVNKYIDNSFLLKVAILGGNYLCQLNFLLKVAQAIRRNKPDVVHFIGDHPSITILYWLLQSEKSIHTFHELNLNRFIAKTIIDKIKEWGLKSRLKRSIKMNENIIFHSLNVQNCFKENFNYGNSFVIPFGVFEIYSNLMIPGFEEYENCILFFGYIRPYKGADIFVKAIHEFNKLQPNNNEKFLIAGKGASQFIVDCPYNLKLVDRFLSDFELANIVRNCKFVVAPHKIASQSGIPNTAFAFNKPIIASDIVGLKEYITDGDTGLLFNNEDYIDLANKIIQLNQDASLYQYIINSISQSKHITPWNVIAKQTIKLYEIVSKQKLNKAMMLK